MKDNERFKGELGYLPLVVHQNLYLAVGLREGTISRKLGASEQPESRETHAVTDGFSLPSPTSCVHSLYQVHVLGQAGAACAGAMVHDRLTPAKIKHLEQFSPRQHATWQGPPASLGLRRPKGSLKLLRTAWNELRRCYSGRALMPQSWAFSSAKRGHPDSANPGSPRT